MKIRNVLSGVCGIVLAFSAFLPVARADVWNQQTELSFSQPVEIPGRVLPAGRYWFVLLNSPSDRNVVQIFSSDWSKEYATLETVSQIRTQSTDKTEVQFAERRHDKPVALLSWYYPGELTGHEFLYSPRHERQFAREVKEEIVAGS